MELKAMKNIGPAMEKKLKAIDVHSAEDLAELGSREAYFKMKAVFPEVCTTYLYVLQGAIDGVGMAELSGEVKADLKAFGESLASRTLSVPLLQDHLAE